MNFCNRRGVPVNDAQMEDIDKLIMETPAIQNRIQKLIAMTACEPFEVIINNMPQELQQSMKLISRRLWIRLCPELIKWKIGFGIVPMFLKEIKGTAHKYPVIPQRCQGHIATYESDDRGQVFEWVWTKGPMTRKMQKPEIYWAYTGYEPDLMGNLRTPIMACLEKYRMLKKLQEDLLYASYHNARPTLVYEDRPPPSGRDVRGEFERIDLFQTDTTYSDYTKDRQDNVRQKMTLDRTREFEQQLVRNGIIHNNDVRSNYNGSVLCSDYYGRDFKRESFVHNRIMLPMDRHVATTVKCTTTADIAQIEQQLARDASELVGIPQEMTQLTSGKIAPNKQGSMMITGEFIKAHIKWLNEVLTDMYKKIYGETIMNKWGKKVYSKRDEEYQYRLYPEKHFRCPDSFIRYELELDEEVDIRVQLNCDPRINENTIIDLHAKGFIDGKEAASQLESITGLRKGTLRAPSKQLQQKKNPRKVENDVEEVEEEPEEDLKVIKKKRKVKE